MDEDALDYGSFDNDDPVISFLVEEQRQFAQLEEEPPATEPESEQVRNWRIEFNNRLVEKDAKEAELVEAMRVDANKALADWHKNKQEELTKLKVERTKMSAQDESDGVQGDCWDKVNQLCNSSKMVRGSGECSRMKTVISSLSSKAYKSNSSD